MIMALTPKMRLLLFKIIAFVTKAFLSYVVMLLKRGTHARGTYALRFEKKTSLAIVQKVLKIVSSIFSAT